MDAEIIVDCRRRRTWPAELKRQIVEESYGAGASVCEVARRHDLDPSQLYVWRKAFRDHEVQSQHFVPVEVESREVALIDEKHEASAPPQTRIEIALTNGRHLFVPAGIEPRLLAPLVAVLDEGRGVGSGQRQ